MALYVPETQPFFHDLEELRTWLTLELQRLADGNEALFRNPLPISFAPPSKLPDASEEILFAFADGVEWDPGSGRGLYLYDGVWKKLNTTP